MPGAGNALTGSPISWCRSGARSIWKWRALRAICAKRTGLIRPDRERSDGDDMAIAVALDAIAERAIDRILFIGGLQAIPGRPEVPTATAFQPDEASASWRDLVARVSGNRRVARAWRKPTGRMMVGTCTTNTSSIATIMQGTLASAPQDLQRSAHQILDLSPLVKKTNCRPDRPQWRAACGRARTRLPASPFRGRG